MTTPPAPAGGHHTPATVLGPTGRDDAASRMAAGRQYLARQGDAYVPAWDDLLPSAQESATTEARRWIQAAINTGLTIVPPGRRVVDLPDPDEASPTGASWTAGTGDCESEFVVILGEDSTVRVSVDGTEFAEDELRAQCLAGLAACDHARMLATFPAQDTDSENGDAARWCEDTEGEAARD